MVKALTDAELDELRNLTPPRIINKHVQDSGDKEADAELLSRLAMRQAFIEASSEGIGISEKSWLALRESCPNFKASKEDVATIKRLQGEWDFLTEEMEKFSHNKTKKEFRAQYASLSEALRKQTSVASDQIYNWPELRTEAKQKMAGVKLERKKVGEAVLKVALPIYKRFADHLDEFADNIHKATKAEAERFDFTMEFPKLLRMVWSAQNQLASIRQLLPACASPRQIFPFLPELRKVA